MAVLKSGAAIAATSTSSAGAATTADQETVAIQPQLPYCILAGGLAVVGFVVGLWLLGHYHPGLTKLPQLAAGVSVFALLYVYAQAIERVLVPVSWFGGGFLGGTGTKKTKRGVAKTRQHALGTLFQTAAPSAAQKKQAADAQHDSEQYSANLTATSFGVASVLAFLATGYTGTLLIHVTGAKIAGWLDLLVTGLAIAGGTKPLHDLISNISSSSKSS